jgi:drug/metabolite transporter (DMT)-like permease
MTARRGLPELVVALASAAWGLFWIPLRAFQSQGLDPAWATVAQFLAPLVALAPLAVSRLVRRLPTGIEQYRTGLLVGAAVALYLQSLLLTEVARALILFYAMPAWGTILEVGLMHRPFTRWRGMALVFSLSGMLAILSSGGVSSGSINLGDLMALLSGLIFALGAMRVRQAPETSVFEQVFAFFLYGFVAAATLTLLPPASLGQPPNLEQFARLAPWLVLVAVGFLIPVMSGIYWGSRSVDPGRLGILLQIEAVVGIASAALLSGEPFGPRQAIGAALVVGAGVVEVLGNREASSQDADLAGSKNDGSAMRPG